MNCSSRIRSLRRNLLYAKLVLRTLALSQVRITTPPWYTRGQYHCPRPAENGAQALWTAGKGRIQVQALSPGHLLALPKLSSNPNGTFTTVIDIAGGDLYHGWSSATRCEPGKAPCDPPKIQRSQFGSQRAEVIFSGRDAQPRLIVCKYNRSIDTSTQSS